MIEPMPDELLIARPQAAMHICGSYVWAAAGTMRATTMTSATETGISPICCQKVDLAARAVRGTHYCTGTSAASQNGSSQGQPPHTGSIVRTTVGAVSLREPSSNTDERCGCDELSVDATRI